jgi:hypothetical protein
MAKYIVFGVLVLAAGGFWYQQKTSTAGPRRAAAALEGAATAGMSFLDFEHKLQDFAGAIALAEQEGAMKSKLRPYKEAFDMYKDSQTLWKIKLDCPTVFEIKIEMMKRQFSCGSGFFGPVQVDAIVALAKKYDVHYDRIPAENLITIDPYNNDIRLLKLQIENSGLFMPLLSKIWSKAAEKARS